MPVHDFICPQCDHQEKNYFFSSSQGIPTPKCPFCAEQPLEIDYSNATRKNRTGRQTFEPVETTDWNGEPVSLTSVQAIREFEKRAAEAGHPHVFRNFSQDRSNKDVGVFGRGEHMKPIRMHSKRGVPFVTRGPDITVDSRDMED